MHYAPKTKENQQHSHLIIRFALPSKNSESIKFKSLAPQRQDFILDTIDLSCEIQITLFELLRCESFNGSEETPGCTKSVTATRVIEFCNSQIIDWTVDPETDRLAAPCDLEVDDFSIGEEFRGFRFKSQHGIHSRHVRLA